MLARPYIGEERRAWVATRVTQRKGCVGDGSGGALVRTGRGHGAYMNVKISLKLSRTSSAPWEVPVE